MKRLLLAVCVLLSLAGCATVNNQQVITANSTAIKTLGNVPVYPGFNLINDQSFTYESGNIDVGRLVFGGNAKISNIVDFYKNALMQLGWQPISVSTYDDKAFLSYITSDRALQIQVEKGFSGTRLVIQVGPRGSTVDTNNQ